MTRLVPTPSLCCLVLAAALAGPWPSEAMQGRGSRAQARRLRARQAAVRAQQRYASGSTALARAGDLGVRYTGLAPTRGLRLEREFPEDLEWAIEVFSLHAEGRPLTAPGILDVDLARISLPPGPYRDPFEVLEVYQELPHGQGWTQLLPLGREAGRRHLLVERDAWGTGRFAYTYRLLQPHALLPLARRPGAEDELEVVFVHGVDGARSDYSGPRDVLRWARCAADRVLFFQYPSGDPIPENGAALARALDAHDASLARPPARRVVIGFSMGGLVSRWALEQVGLKARVDDLVLLATPSRGAEWVGLADYLPFLRHVRDQVERAWPGVKDLEGHSPALRELNRNRAPPPEVRILALAGIADGNGDLVVDADSVGLPPRRRPADYRFHYRADLFNLNLYSHWGVHQEFLRNGFAKVTGQWLGLGEVDCSAQAEARRRRARIEHRVTRLRDRSGGNP